MHRRTLGCRCYLTKKACSSARRQIRMTGPNCVTSLLTKCSAPWRSRKRPARRSTQSVFAAAGNGPRPKELSLLFNRVGTPCREPTHDGWASGNPLKPDFEIWKLRDVLRQIPPQPCPRKTRHIGYGILSREIGAIGQAPVHDAKKPRHFIGVAFDAVRHLFGRVVAEMKTLAGHRSEPADLPKQPLIDI